MYQNFSACFKNFVLLSGNKESKRHIPAGGDFDASSGVLHDGGARLKGFALAKFIAVVQFTLLIRYSVKRNKEMLKIDIAYPIISGSYLKTCVMTDVPTRILLLHCPMVPVVFWVVDVDSGRAGNKSL